MRRTAQLSADARSIVAQIAPVRRVLWRTLVVFAIVGSIAGVLGRNVAVLLVQLGVLGWLWVHVGRSLRNPRQRIVLRGVRARHFAKALAVLVLVLLAVAALLAPHTWLRWGWWEFLGGTGNVILGTTARRRHWVSHLVLPGLILIPLLISLCLFALREERTFRRGDEASPLGERLWRAVLFGLAHLVMGIPVGAALALGVGGFGFSQIYRKRWRESRSRLQSVLESTRVHLAYNLILVSLVAAMLVGTAAGARASPAQRSGSQGALRRRSGRNGPLRMTYGLRRQSG